MEKMDEDDVIIFSCATITLACALEIQKKPRRNRIRKTWMKDWLRKRDTKGAYVNILQELRLNDHELLTRVRFVFFVVAFDET